MSFPSGGKRTKQILELVHSDVFGPVKVLSLGKSVYYASHLNTLICEREGFLPVHTSCGILSSNADEGDLLTR